MVLFDTFYIVVALIALVATVVYVDTLRRKSTNLLNAMTTATTNLICSVHTLETKVANITEVSKRQIQNLETSLEAAKKRANSAESKLAAIYTQHPHLRKSKV